jgi:hypothetical protein
MTQESIRRYDKGRPQEPALALPSNRLLNEVVRENLSRPMNWERSVLHFKQGYIYERHDYDMSLFMSSLSEIHILLALQDSAHQTCNADGSFCVQSDPVQLGRRFGSRGSFAFRRDPVGKLVVFDHDTGNIHTEIDALATIDGLPTAFEIKLTTKDHLCCDHVVLDILWNHCKIILGEQWHLLRWGQEELLQNLV